MSKIQTPVATRYIKTYTRITVRADGNPYEELEPPSIRPEYAH